MPPKIHLISVTRYHDISCGHRVVGHEGKCRYLHGHNYRIHFTLVGPQLDSVGRVVDFSVIKSKLCEWLENNWDHQFLVFEADNKLNALIEISPDSIVTVPFNPTAENMAQYLLEFVGPLVLPSHLTLTKVVVEETRKCSATARLNPWIN